MYPSRDVISQTPFPILLGFIYLSITPEINISLIAILVKIGIFEILLKFDPIFRCEVLEIAKKPEDMLKTIALAS